MSISLESRIKGGFYGLACGDALGATLEFMNAAEIDETFGGQLKDIIGGGWLNLKAGQWTDDTDMTIAVARGILANPEDPIEEIGRNFLAWMATDPPDIGSTCRASMRRYQAGELGVPFNDKWHQAAKAVHVSGMKTAGNGALMRTLPVALAYTDPDVIFKKAIDIARMTHWDPEAGLTCAYYCELARSLIMDPKINVLVSAVWRVKSHCERLMPGAIGAWRKIHYRNQEDILDEIMRGNDKCPAKPTGYTVDSLMCALWAFAWGKDLEDCIIRAVNLGGDADTIGAIAGGLAGVHYGYEAIPKRWLDKFTADQKKTLDDLSDRILTVRKMRS